MSTSGGTPQGQPQGTGSISIATTGTAPYVVPLINDSSTWRGINSARNISDNNTGANTPTNAVLLATSLVNFTFQRTPNVFKPLNAVAVGSEATIWTPAAGKKFRLMGIVISSGTVGGGILLNDNTAGTLIAIVPTTTVAVAVTLNLGNGILSVAANNVLTATGVATETITGIVFGTEE